MDVLTHGKEHNDGGRQRGHQRSNQRVWREAFGEEPGPTVFVQRGVRAVRTPITGGRSPFITESGWKLFGKEQRTSHWRGLVDRTDMPACVMSHGVLSPPPGNFRVGEYNHGPLRMCENHFKGIFTPRFPDGAFVRLRTPVPMLDRFSDNDLDRSCFTTHLHHYTGGWGGLLQVVVRRGRGDAIDPLTGLEKCRGANRDKWDVRYWVKQYGSLCVLATKVDERHLRAATFAEVTLGAEHSRQAGTTRGLLRNSGVTGRGGERWTPPEDGGGGDTAGGGARVSPTEVRLPDERKMEVPMRKHSLTRS